MDHLGIHLPDGFDEYVAVQRQQCVENRFQAGEDFLSTDLVTLMLSGISAIEERQKANRCRFKLVVETGDFRNRFQIRLRQDRNTSKRDFLGSKPVHVLPDLAHRVQTGNVYAQAAEQVDGNADAVKAVTQQADAFVVQYCQIGLNDISY